MFEHTAAGYIVYFFAAHFLGGFFYWGWLETHWRLPRKQEELVAPT